MIGIERETGWPPFPVPGPERPPGRPGPPEPPPPERPRRPGIGERRDEPSAVVLELYDRLLQRRIVMLAGWLGPDECVDAAAKLMLLDADSGDPIELHLSCPDADLAAALTLADTLDLLRSAVTVIALGSVGGPALAVLAAADRRRAHPNCRLVLREPHGSATGSADQVRAAADQHADLVRTLVGRIAAVSSRPPEQIAADLRAGRVLTAQQAVDYGLLEEITHRDR